MFSVVCSLSVLTTNTVPSAILEEQRMKVFNRATAWLKEVHGRHGYVFEEEEEQED